MLRCLMWVVFGVVQVSVSYAQIPELDIERVDTADGAKVNGAGAFLDAFAVDRLANPDSDGSRKNLDADSDEKEIPRKLKIHLALLPRSASSAVADWAAKIDHGHGDISRLINHYSRTYSKGTARVTHGFNGPAEANRANSDARTKASATADYRLVAPFGGDAGLGVDDFVTLWGEMTIESGGDFDALTVGSYAEVTVAVDGAVAAIFRLEKTAPATLWITVFAPNEGEDGTFGECTCIDEPLTVEGGLQDESASFPFLLRLRKDDSELITVTTSTKTMVPTLLVGQPVFMGLEGPDGQGGAMVPPASVTKQFHFGAKFEGSVHNVDEAEDR